MTIDSHLSSAMSTFYSFLIREESTSEFLATNIRRASTGRKTCKKLLTIAYNEPFAYVFVNNDRLSDFIIIVLESP